MSDVVVTVPQSFGLERWIAEGDAAGEPWSGQEWAFNLGGPLPAIEPGERVYIVYGGRLRGFAPLIRVEPRRGGCALIRGGGAEAVTIPERIVGFRGYRYRWWRREDEGAAPLWRRP